MISPGLPPEPITLRKIERLDYIACSRNPKLARGLSFFERIEEQGDGLRRIVRESEAIGLRRPLFRYRDGHFQVTFFAPEDMLKLKSQGVRPVFEVKKDILEGLSETQKDIIQILMVEHEINVPALAKKLGLALTTIRKAIGVLRDKRLIIQRGKARETTYPINLPEE